MTDRKYNKYCWGTKANSEDGASLVEYSLLVALIAVATLAATRTVGNKVGAVLTNAGTQMAAAGDICLTNPNDPSCP